MASRLLEEDRRSNFLWTIGLKYAQIAPELSRYYFSKYQQLQRDDTSLSFLRKICPYCGSLFDGSNSRTRISKKTSPSKKKDAQKCQKNAKNCSSRRKNKSTLSVLCFVCKKSTVYDGSERSVRQKRKMAKNIAGGPSTPSPGIQTKLPENYSSLSASAKRKWRNKVRLNKLRLMEGVEQSGTKTTEDRGTGLLAFLSSLEK